MSFLAGIAFGIVIALAGMYLLSVWLEWDIDDKDDIR